MRIGVLSLFIFLVVILNDSYVFSEDAYTWIDSSGKRVYGSKPPSNAKSKKLLKTDNFSKYSSQIENQKRFVDTFKKGKAGKKKKLSNAKNSPKIKSFSPEKSKYLKVNSVSLDLDAYNEIRSCKAIIKNDSALKINEISVTFKFSDGSLIPSTGPYSLLPGESREYRIPETLIPLALFVGDVPEDDVLITEPDVIIHRR